VALATTSTCITKGKIYTIDQEIRDGYNGQFAAFFTCNNGPGHRFTPDHLKEKFSIMPKEINTNTKII
jgi:hypothetical protein